IDFEIKERVVWIGLRGEVDDDWGERLREKVRNYLEREEIGQMVVNLGDLWFMERCGLGVILGR
uniref:STAS domain-containing protein n=1 Tax=Bacillus altitudinis TaxID=293387 RepID=UPI00307DBB0A